MTRNISVHKLQENATLPTYGTPDSACFDIHACFQKETGFHIKANGGKNILYPLPEGVYVHPGDWALIPTGLIFVFPRGLEMELRPRSGNAWKSGYTLLNSPGTIDSDYTGELFVMVHNVSRSESICIGHGDRIAQGMIQSTKPICSFTEVPFEAVEEKKAEVERTGGFGSTGK